MPPSFFFGQTAHADRKDGTRQAQGGKTPPPRRTQGTPLAVKGAGQDPAAPPHTGYTPCG